MNGAALLVNMLEAYGVKVVFGVPGETSIPLYAALSERAGAIRHVMARDERSAGYMADAYARVTNKPGVTEFPSGAGPLYGIAAVAEANESSVPLIAITSDNSLAVEGRGFIAEIDCQSLFKPVTKESILLKSARMIPETIRRAFRIATSGRPGAVHITVPENIWHEEVDGDEVSLHVEEPCKASPSYPAPPSRQDISALIDLLSNAKRPLIVAGGGVNRSNAGEALTKFAERAGVPVVTSITGQQSIPDDHELAFGVAGDNGFHPHANRAVDLADVLVYVGSKIGSVITIGWTLPEPNGGRTIVQVDVNPETIGNNTTNDLAIVADAKSLFESLLADQASQQISRSNDWIAQLSSWRNKFQEQSAKDIARLRTANSLHPQYIMDALRRRLPPSSLVFSDPGTPTPYSCRYLNLEGEGARLIMQRSYGGLGYAIPAVIGGWFANPKIRPIGMFGDGSLGMSIGELETIMRVGAPAILLNFNNSSFGWIEAHKKMRGHHNSLPLDFLETDYSALARSVGLLAMRAETPQELEGVLDEAFAHDGPVFIDLPVESVADETPPVYTFMKNSGVNPLEVGGQTLT